MSVIPPHVSTASTDALHVLADEIGRCRACQLAGFLERANPIRPTELTRPRMMLIGQAPGTRSDDKGYHFAGPAGRFLERWLDRAGFPPGYLREHVYLTSLTRCFPGKASSGGDRPPSRAEMGLCRRFLDRELELLQPPLVLLLGKMAIDVWLPARRPLTETVGQTVTIDGRLCLPLPHASAVSRWLNTPANQARLDQALQELARLRIALQLG